MLRRGLPIAFGIALVLAAHDAHADDKASAQALFDEGLALFDAREFAKAAADFSNSQKLDPAAGTLLNLARCYEAMGNVATAWQTYGAAAAQARKDGDAKRERAAAQKEAALGPTVPRLTIALVGANPSSVRVERDGAVVDASTLGTPVLVDPGAHKILATAPGRKPWSTDVVLVVGGAARIEIPSLESTRVESAPKPPVEEPASPPSSGLGTQRKIAIVSAGVGLVAVGVGAYFGLHAGSLKSDADAHCASAKCDADGVSLTDRAGSSADLATVFFIAGGAFIAGATALWFTAPSAAPAQNSTSAGKSRNMSVTARPTFGPTNIGGAVQLTY